MVGGAWAERALIGVGEDDLVGLRKPFPLQAVSVVGLDRRRCL